MRIHTLCILLVVACVGLSGQAAFGADKKPAVPEEGRTNPKRSAQQTLPKQPTKQELVFFEKKIRSVLVEQCYKCHSATAK